MTHIYFVRHAYPKFSWEDDMTRPLTDEGKKDSIEVKKALNNVKIDYVISSPYKRSVDTIKECVESKQLEINTDIRLREREKGVDGNTSHSLIRKRWSDFNYHEEGGESLQMVQDRNIEALYEVIENHAGENIIWGTHGTALSTILNFFDNSYNADSFYRIINFMPYIIRLDFEGKTCVGKEEILIVEKEFKG